MTQLRVRLKLFIVLSAGLLLASTQSYGQHWIYTTVKGDNLWDFSEKHLDRVTRFEQIRKINNIEYPKKMRPGTRLRIPFKWVRSSNSVPAEIQLFSGGNLKLKRAKGNTENLVKFGTKIYLGDELITGNDTSVAVQFADHSILTLHSNSRLHFDHLTAHGTTGMVDSRVRLLSGRMDTRVKSAVGPGSRFEIHTPSAISAVRGTEYRASVNEETKLSRIEVLEGKVKVSAANRDKLLLAGFGTRVAQGKEPEQVVALLSAPELEDIPVPIRSLNAMILWQSIKGAVQYRVELSNNSLFNTLIWEQLSHYNRAALPELDDGSYYLRIRGIDSQGLEGRGTIKKLVQNARPQPPVQLKPDVDAVLRGKAPTLQWTNLTDAKTYRLRIASDEGFEQLLLTRDGLTDTRFDTSELSEPGSYYWQLNSIAADGEVGPESTIRHYEIRPMPEKVQAQLASPDDGKLVATWSQEREGLNYQVQLSKENTFTILEMDVKTDKAQLSFDAVSGQVRYLRVRAIEADGYQGPWGSIQRVDPLPDDTWWWVPALGIFGFLLL
ncbi:MAG: LysM peptidoglycan-binding domain-containing protein [Gammaproteobacteria bacterium]|nr:LysM peptidoglycan-binding domain-containing protein [Gammaproteobacteria bacterium]